MLKQTLTFEDFDGNDVTEDHYFHLSKAELVDMAIEDDGEDMASKLQSIAESGDAKIIMAAFKDILSRAYGQRDPVNAQKFVKSPAISEEFMNSLAFDALFSKLLTDGTFAAAFINGIIPKDLRDMPEVQRAVTEVQLPPHPFAMPAKMSKDEIRRAIAETPVSQVLPSDPNRLDEAGVWPAATPENVADASATRLNHPFDSKGELLPWAFREPTDREVTAMTSGQLQDVYKRKSSGWTPPVTAPS